VSLGKTALDRTFARLEVRPTISPTISNNKNTRNKALTISICNNSLQEVFWRSVSAPAHAIAVLPNPFHLFYEHNILGKVNYGIFYSSLIYGSRQLKKV
jgi:hypothetical protein